MELILASGSKYRAEVLREAGYDFEVDVPQVDERASDHLFTGAGAEVLAVELARMKADSVAERHPSIPIVACDQVGVLGRGEESRMLTKTPTVDEAVNQLMAISGTRHRLVNGVVVSWVEPGRETLRASGVDVQVVQMATYDEGTARSYVEAYEPFDTAGSYRLEDDLGLVEAVEGEDTTGVLGMPLPLLDRLLERLLDDLEAKRAEPG
ncbi:MAG: Maf family protein [Microthrixaceae bacterium]